MMNELLPLDLCHLNYYLLGNKSTVLFPFGKKKKKLSNYKPNPFAALAGSLAHDKTTPHTCPVTMTTHMWALNKHF